MDARLKALAEKIGRMTSEEAADWLLANFPIENAGYGDAIAVVGHRSWRRAEQMRIARHYLKKIPFASAKPYEVFASFMSIGNFLQVIEERLPEECTRRSLLLYYSIPVLQRAAKSDADRERIAIFHHRYVQCHDCEKSATTCTAPEDRHMESIFSFYEVVHVSTDRSALRSIDNCDGAVLGMVQSDDGNWAYSVHIFDREESWSVLESELMTRGWFMKREDFYLDQTVSVGVDGELKDHL